MSNSKLVVLSLRSIFKKGIAVLLVALAVGFAIHHFTGDSENEQSAKYIKGSYTAEISIKDDTIPLTVTLSNDKIESIEVSELTKEQQAFYPLLSSTIAAVSTKVLETQSLEFASDKDSKYTSNLVVSAIDEAVSEGINE